MHPATLDKNCENRSEKDKPLVIVIDNDIDNLLFASYAIESFGMNCVFINKSEECLKLVNSLLPDIILLDIVMPKVNGLEITRIIKQDTNTAHIPIIAVTGLTRDKEKREIMAAGCDDYLLKPYLIEELEAKVFSHLKQHSSSIQQ